MQRYARKVHLSRLLQTIYVKFKQAFCQKVLASIKLYRIRAKSAKFNTLNILFLRKYLPYQFITILRIPKHHPYVSLLSHYVLVQFFLYLKLNYLNEASPHAAGSLLPLISINGLISSRLCRIPLWVSTPFKNL